MRTRQHAVGLDSAAPIVALLDVDTPAALPGSGATPRAPLDELARARAFAEPLLGPRQLDTQENAQAHADGVAAILAGIGAAPALQAAAYLVYAADALSQPEEVIGRAFGPSHASLVAHTRQLVAIQRAARRASPDTGEARAQQTERVRKMLMAFSRDLRVVLLRLASRLQTLRHYAASKSLSCPQELALESQQVFAPLANRLGIWQIKWEMEDLAFRFLEPQRYRELARALAETRVEREARVEAARRSVAHALQEAGLEAQVAGRPKHLYSIWKKMQGKGLALSRIFDLLALRVIVPSVADCYAALSRLHELYTPVEGEFDDYIARPKPNGYQSLHTILKDRSGRAMEVQIRTREMHEHAEQGVAAHWAYKEAGTRGYAGVTAASADTERANARKAVLQQLLAWEREFTTADASAADADRVYVLTPQATIIELTAGATPIDLAYAVHTDLGHRCRGARVDGAMVPLNTPLKNGQTVEITAAREGGPSLDWLNPELGFLQSPRARAKVRAWFNARQQHETIARGRELVEKLLQREGRTALKHLELAQQLGFADADALFEVVGKDEYSLRHIESLLRPAAPPAADESAHPALRKPGPSSRPSPGGVLVVGVDSLLTTLARCCRPAPPDAIAGYVTRGQGVAVHRQDCSNFRQMAERLPERVIAVAWGGAGEAPGTARYAVDVIVQAQQRPHLLRDVLDVFAKERVHVQAVQSGPLRGSGPEGLRLRLTVEVNGVAAIGSLLRQVAAVPGVRLARRI